MQQSCAFIASYEGEIPGATAIECGNYREHNLEKAKSYAADMAEVLRDWTPDRMVYEV